jgi:dihydroorotate dehydrogenase (NAD+) catalytic subunit
MVVPADLTARLGPLTLPNPVMLASGTCAYGLEMEPYGDLDGLGAIVVKGLSLERSAGNPPPRIVETPSGMLNSIGLENIGVEAFLRDKLPLLREKGARVIVNIYGQTLDEYRRLAEILGSTEGICALEANISCPNVKKGGLLFGQDGRETQRVVEAVRKETGKPLLVKLTPNVTDVGEIARAAVDGGADALTLINTLQGMAVDVESRRPALANVLGGLSGPAIRPVAVRCLWQARQAVSVPLIGVGGIHGARDALEFIIAGASAVQLGTVNFVYPGRWREVVEGIEAYLQGQGMTSLAQIVGSLEV